MHSPIQLQDIAFSLPYKICFEGFTTQVHCGSRIAIIGCNGSGKSTLLKILQLSIAATSGSIKIPDNVRIGYVPQVIDSFEHLSGSQRLNKALSGALSVDPNILLLDEPTNHLDLSNRKSLIRMLKAFPGTLIVVSHDVTLLRDCFDTFWHMENGQIQQFTGKYDDYMREIEIKCMTIKEEISQLNREKKRLHQSLMKEQNRAAKSRAKGEKNIDKRKWPTIVNKAKAGRASKTTHSKKSAITQHKQKLCERLSTIHFQEIISPKFELCSTKKTNHTLAFISEGKVGYGNDIILDNISFSITTDDRIAIMGNNGSGKSTLIKAILNDINVVKSGIWHTPIPQDIGYLDQHYRTLTQDKSVLETIEVLVPTWNYSEIRFHLNDFLFRKNEEVNALVATLSGGEKVRLTLAQIAAKPPKLLILDEVTNNLDLNTREHVIQVLQKYPGAMIVISHDEDFLRSIKIQDFYQIKERTLVHACL